jgi:hypothetical protein
MRSVIWRLMIGAPTLLFILNCRRPVQYDYYDFDFQKPPDVRQLIWRSSSIVVGKVLGVKTNREGVPARKKPEMLLDELRVDFAPENILLGDAPQTTFSIVLFEYSRKNRFGYSGPPPLAVVTGERRMFFLTRDSGVYRSVADVRGDNQITVWSGLHKNVQHVDDMHNTAWIYPYPTDSAIGNAMADILLELGEGYSSSGVSHTLNSTAYLCSILTNRRKTAARLQKLVATTSAPEISAQACLILAEQYYGQYACLATLTDNPALPPETRRSLAEMRAKRVQWNERLKQGLKTWPLFSFNVSPFSDSISGVQQELELLLDDPDLELRQLACSILKQNYPGQEATCTSRK